MEDEISEEFLRQKTESDGESVEETCSEEEDDLLSNDDNQDEVFDAGGPKSEARELFEGGKLFSLFITDEMIGTLVSCTNKEMEMRCQKYRTKHGIQQPQTIHTNQH
uniref:Uncharacterized protein n=1 Tax=Rhodnius prolixus TaxID=13249 RepID=T1I494_RHOPR